MLARRLALVRLVSGLYQISQFLCLGPAMSDRRVALVRLTSGPFPSLAISMSGTYHVGP